MKVDLLSCTSACDVLSFHGTAATYTRDSATDLPLSKQLRHMLGLVEIMRLPVMWQVL